MSNATATADSNLGFAARSETLLSVMFLLALVVLIVPLPTFLLDMLLAANLASCVFLLLITLGAKRPLDLSVFPSLLLLMTLFRLSLNVATTRLILLHGDAGKIVMTFGDFVVGGSLVVGIVIFAILVIIQFVVITKGASRISEVNARFTLDAMPGKQMAIDAELNMGAIDEAEAKRRRQELVREAEFFGAMDGAGKYVRGDAIAGLIILAVNIVGGIIRGMMDGQQLMDAVEFYATLTIGDGLVSQIPALVIATSAGILVTKSSSDSNLGQEIGRQLTRNHVAMYSGAAILTLIAFTPGFPKFPFFAIAAGVAIYANVARKQQEQANKPTAAPAKVEDPTPPEEKNLNQFLQSDRILIEVGPGLIGLIEPKHGKSIADRIATLRAEVAQQNGFWVPRARIRDNLQLPVHEYRIMVCGREVGRGELRPHDYLAINPSQQPIDLPGESTTDPAFGMPAKWIPESSSHRAKLLGYTVVDVPTVLITHLRESLRRHAHELLSREDMQKMLTKLRETSPTIVDEIKPEIVRPAVLHQVLVNLLMEQVPITALESILEATVQHGVTVKDPSELTERVRGSIGHLVVDRFRDEQQRIRVVCLEPQVEFRLRELVDDGKIPLPPKPLQRLIEQIRKQWEIAVMKNQPAAIIVDASIRRPLRRTIFRSVPEVAILAYNEIPNSALIQPAGFIRASDVFEDERPGPRGDTAESLANVAA